MLDSRISQIINDVLIELKRVRQDHSCVFASAVLLDSFQKNGITNSFPMTVRAQIYNPIMTEFVKKEGMTTDPQKLEAWKNEGGQIGFLGGTDNLPAPPKNWAGHLVILIPLESSYLLLCDLTLTQASNSALGFDLQPAVTKVSNQFVGGKELAQVRNGRCLVNYKAFPQDRTFESSSLWTDLEARKKFVERIGQFES